MSIPLKNILSGNTNIIIYTSKHTENKYDAYIMFGGKNICRLLNSQAKMSNTINSLSAKFLNIHLEMEWVDLWQLL